MNYNYYLCFFAGCLSVGLMARFSRLEDNPQPEKQPPVKVEAQPVETPNPATSPSSMKWERLPTAYTTDGDIGPRAYRARVVEGWIVAFTPSVRDNHAQAAVYVPDPNNRWVLEQPRR